jgi:hypothetical protein
MQLPDLLAAGLAEISEQTTSSLAFAPRLAARRDKEPMIASHLHTRVRARMGRVPGGGDDQTAPI